MSELGVCRLCYADQRKCIPLKEENIAEMLETLTAHKIVCNENISSVVCPDCFAELKCAFDIRQKFLAVETKHQDVPVADILIDNRNGVGQLVKQEMGQLEIDDAGEKTQKSVDPLTKYSCICSQKFQFSKDIIEHISTAKHKDAIFCDQCGTVFYDMKVYTEHKSTHCTRKFMCHLCSEIYNTRDALDQHVQQTHSDLKQFTCDICNEKFSLRFILQAHRNQHNNHYPFKCKNCGKEFKHQMSLNMHQKIAH